MVAITDQDGKEVPTGQEGDLCLRIDSGADAGLGRFTVCLGYIQPNGSYDRRERHEKGGSRRWFVSGDRAILDNDGYFQYVGRGDDGASLKLHLIEMLSATY